MMPRRILVSPRDGEIAEDEGDDEDVVDRENLLDDIALEIGRHGVCPVACHQGAVRPGPPDVAAKGDGDGDVEGRELEAFGDAKFVIVLVKDAEVKGHQRDHDGKEHQPKPERLVDEFIEEKIHGVPRA